MQLPFKLQKQLSNSLKFILIISIILLSISFPTFSRTVQDVQKDIESKKQEMKEVESTINEIETSLNEQRKALDEIVGKRARVNAEIAINQQEADLIRQKLEDLEESRKLTILEKEKREIIQNNVVLDSYINWKQTNFFRDYLSSDSADFMKILTYQATVAGEEQKSIETLGNEIDQIEKDLIESEEQKALYNKKLDELSVQYNQLQSEINELDTKIKANENDMSNYRSQMGAIQSQIDQLTAEQIEIQRREAELLKKASKKSGGGTKELITGEIYFNGIGREIYQGHGVGMSQFGALGAALKGWDYKKILQHYYPNTEIIEYKGRDTINVTGYGSISVEDYVAGAGEVPDYSCEELEIEFDYNNIWKCWPEDAIKAQAVAFRSYGLAKTMDGSSICTTAACQVYKGGENKRWAADDTAYEVVAYEGEPISAFYSSDNHNGWGTANNDTVWSDMDGNGVPKPYLRAVNDESIAFEYTYTKWAWRTNSYSIEDVNEMLDWSISSSTASDKYRTFLSEIKSDIGAIRTISFDRDPSGRVNKVTVAGLDGSRQMAGWLFKSVWNIWIGSEKPSGEEDYIYSLTYYMNTVN